MYLQMHGVTFLHLCISFQVTFQLILWFVPTFFWPGEPLPVEPVSRVGDSGPVSKEAEERFGALVDNLSNSSGVAVYNRLMCPRCIAQNMAIATLLVSS